MYITSEDPLKKREKNIKQFSDPLNRKANYSVNAQINKNAMEKNTIQLGAESLNKKNAPTVSKNTPSGIVDGAKHLQNDTKSKYLAIDDEMEYNEKVNKVNSVSKNNGYIYDADGMPNYAATIRKKYDDGSLTLGDYNLMIQERAQKIKNNPSLYGQMDVGVLSDAEYLDLVKRNQDREELHDDFQKRYSGMEQYAKQIGSATEQYAVKQRDNAIKNANLNAEELKRLAEQEWYSRTIPQVNEQIANMGVSNAGGYSRQQVLETQAALMNEKNNIELEKQKMILDAETEFANLMMQGKTDEASALLDIATQMETAYNNRISELDNEAVSLTEINSNKEKNVYDTIQKILLQEDEQAHDITLTDKNLDNDLAILGEQLKNNKDLAELEHGYEMESIREQGNQDRMTKATVSPSSSNEVKTFDDMVADVMTVYSKLGKDSAKAYIDTLPISDTDKITLKGIVEPGAPGSPGSGWDPRV